MNIDQDPQNIERTIVKKISHDEKFKRFLTLLSDRDCLIVRIIYFHPISLSSLTTLRVHEIEYDALPESLQTDLQEHTSKKKPHDLVFVNSKNEPVSRVHIIQAVGRACAKMKCNYTLSLSDIAEWTRADSLA